ncbi:ABC transporter permease [Tuberibacillus sp. Marseille-P3662]|uniref:ABC transporter permease n=1 Tax=Tuberibacillus sp. Marseille-P3662 TaxID=1965358 RepID=UPI000A1CEB32|nr:ABC transporter permease [Tuberibacillus sp. Marseille-P3662]
MSSFINLVKNENMKLMLKRSTQIMTALLIVFIIGAALLIKFTSDSPDANDNDQWKQELKEQNQTYQQSMEKNDNVDYKQQIALNEYRIEHDLEPEGNNVWSFVKDMVGLTMIISLFTIIAAAGSVANEFSWGTIKLLLIRPVSRAKILLSKYVSSLLYAVVLILILFVVSFIIGGLFFGFEGLTHPELIYQDGQVDSVNMIGYIFAQYGFKVINLIMMTTFAFMISSIFRNSALAIGLAVFLMLAGNMIMNFLMAFGFDWAKYVLFANTDLSRYYSGSPMFDGMTLTFSIVVLVVYYIIFVALSWWAFTKRDVAA